MDLRKFLPERVMRSFAFGLVVVVMPLAAWAQPDAGAILRRVSDVYRDAKQYQLAAKSVVAGGDTTIEIAIQRPNKFRINADGALLGGESDQGRLIMVSDGARVWTYSSEFKQYTIDEIEQPAPGEPVAPESPFLQQFESLLLVRYIQFAEIEDRAQIVRQESIQGAGGLVACYVLEIKPPGADEYTWWVDKKRFVVLREDTKPSDPGRPATSVIYNIARINETLPDELFKFTPPLGAKLVDELGVL